MNLDDIAAELLAAPLSEFTSRRNAKARELKASQQGELAGQVATLKKPPVALWAVNRLARRDRARLNRIREAGQSVVQAQAAAVAGRKNAAPELRQASSSLQRELEAAVKAAAEVLREDGHAADEATLRRIQEVLRLAAVTGGETWRRLERGALITEPRAGEDMLTAAFAIGGGSAGAGATPRAVGAVTRRPGGDARAKAAEATAARLARTQAAQAEKRLEMEHAVRTARMDKERAHEASETAKRLRRQADEMAAEARRAAQRARQAERDAEQATGRATASQRAARRFKAAD